MALQLLNLQRPADRTRPYDLDDVTVTDAAGITVNRSKGNLDPFAPILKSPTYSEHSGTHSGYAVEIADPAAPTGFRHVGSVSRNYLLLSNEEVRELAIEIAIQSRLPFKESLIYWDGSRFLHRIDFLGHTEAVEPGDEIALSLVTMSSYDKSWRYRCALGAFRLVCENGCLAGDFFGDVNFKHVTSTGDPKEDSWRGIVRQGLSVIDRAPDDIDRFVQAMRVLKGARMTDARLREVWRALPGLGHSVKGRILDRYVEAEEATMYGLFNAGTWAFSHRGEKTTAADFGNNDDFSTAMLALAERMN